MVSSRVGSLSLVSDVLRDVSASQIKLADLQNQISSGYKSRNFAGMNGDVEKFTQVSGQLDRAAQFDTNNKLNISKLQTIDAVLDKITTIADSIKNNIVGANGAVLKTANLPQIVNDLLVAFGSQLNTTFNGQYVFGGTDTVNPPVPTTNGQNAVIGVPDDVYYAGSHQDATLRLDDRTEVAFPVRADDPAFQKIYAAAKQAVSSAIAGDAVGLSKAQQLIQQGQSELSAIRSRVGTTVVNIESTNARLKELTTYWKELTDDVSKTDLLAASTQVAGYQAILQASYQIYSRLSQLRLSDYLR